ncbi:MAG: hypothetical protein GF331_10005 [Chitinivibrionales bacterium]|nr:hypothetical protein [Chitinivibrionales bacterium]
MTVVHRFIDEPSVLVLAGEGHFDLKSAIDTLARVIRTPEYHQSVGTVIDFRGVELDFQAEDIRSMVDSATSLGGLVNRRIALLTASDGPRYALARDAAAIAALRGADARVFTEMSEAMEWLGEVGAAQGRQVG